MNPEIIRAMQRLETARAIAERFNLHIEKVYSYADEIGHSFSEAQRRFYAEKRARIFKSYAKLGNKHKVARETGYSLGSVKAILGNYRGIHGAPKAPCERGIRDEALGNRVFQLACHGAKLFGDSMEALTGNSRKGHLVKARHAIAYVARSHIKCESISNPGSFEPVSYPVIGRALGGRDHTTIINSYQQAEILLPRSPSFAGKVAALTALVDIPFSEVVVPVEEKPAKDREAIRRAVAALEAQMKHGRRPESIFRRHEPEVVAARQRSDVFLAALQRERQSA